MKQLIVLAGLMGVGILFSTCDRKEEDKIPVPCFTPSKEEAVVGELIAFNNCSTDADAYSWNFGDGSATTSETSPSHAFTVAKQYSVVLKAWNKNNEREITKIITITGGNTTQPVACFTPSVTSAEIGVSISFSNCSADATSFSWNFGDGSSTSTQQNPSHSYTTAGTYDVVLTAYNGELSDTETKSITITNVNNTDPVACFSIDPTTANINQYIYTTNCSQNATSYEWDLENDGTVETTDANPVIYYTATGTFTIKLTAYNGSKQNSITHTVTIVDAPIDPTVYDMPVNWDEHYVDEYTVEDTDWPIGTGDGYNAAISGGYYTVTNTLTDTYWTFTTGAAAMPSSSSNFDFELYFSITTDPDGYGDGLVWGKDPNAFNYDFFVFKYGTSIGNYYLGDVNSGTWNYWTGDYWLEGGNSSGYNRLTIRKYDNKYYFFINKIYMGASYDFNAYFGEKFGYWIGPGTALSADWIGIWTVSTAKAGFAGERTGKQFNQQAIVKSNRPAKAVKNSIDLVKKLK